MMICPHCKMWMKPMGFNCEFCGKSVKKKFKKKQEKE